MSDYQYLRLDHHEHVATLTVDHPPVNALSHAALQEMDSVLDVVAQDSRIKAMVVTGAGERAFVAGADIKVFARVHSPDDAIRTANEYIQLGQAVFLKLDTLPIPTIAAINGICMGGGMELALACDIRYAAENATLGQPEINLGIIPGWGGTQRLPRLIGMSQALELILTGEAIPATRALQLGLVNRVIPAAELLAAAQQLAHTIAAHGRVAITAARHAVTGGVHLSLEDGLTLELQQFASALATEDAREGIAAFLEKRRPLFQDR